MGDVLLTNISTPYTLYYYLPALVMGLAPNFTKFHFDVAHPKILDDGSDDHPCPTTASSTVHQAVSTLRMVGNANVENKIIGRKMFGNWVETSHSTFLTWF